MELVIIVRKQVEDPAEGKQIFELVKERLQDREDITIQGHVTNHFSVGDEPQ